MRFTLGIFCLIFASFCVSAQPNIDKTIAHLKTINNTKDAIESYTQIFQYYQYTEPDSAYFYLEQGLAYFMNRKDENGKAAMLVLLAFMDSTHGRIESAKQKHKEALAIYEKTGHKQGIATALNGLGVIAGKTGNYTEAVNYFMRALEMFESINDREGVVNTYLKLGAVNEQNDNLQKALEYYNTAIAEIEKKPIDGTQLIYLYNNVAIVYARQGDTAKARRFLEMALAGSDDPDRTGVRILTLNNLGILYDKADQNKRSLSYFEQAIKIAKDKQLPDEYSRLMVSRASVINKSDPAAAVATLKEALHTVEPLGLKALMADIYDCMVESYDKMGDYKDAFLTLNKLKLLQDTLFSMEKEKEIMNLQSMHDLERSNVRIGQMEEQHEASEKMRFIIVGVALLLSVMLLLLTFQYRKMSKLNAMLKKREADLTKSNDIKDRLFSIIGHDLRGPIGNIPVMLQLLEDPSTSADERKFIMESLVVHSTATQDTLNKLLFWGQTQIKGVGIKQQNFEVGEHIDTNLELINRTATHKHITVTSSVDSKISVYADPSHFDFILRNLLSNAVKFTRQGGNVSLSADITTRPGFVIFAVSDNGVGMSEEKMQNVFKPFSVSTRGTGDEKGTGIGLMLCNEFVTENGGDIWIESQEGKGSIFRFSLKAA